VGRLSGKVAFITGAGSGIGRAAAILFAKESAKVIVAELSVDAGNKTLEEIKSAGGDGIFIETDVTDVVSVGRSLDAAAAKYGQLNVLYNNAGGSSAHDGAVTDVSVEEFWRAVKLDLFGTFLCCKHGVPHLIKAGGGSVINVSSMVALMGWPGKDAYTCAKGGVSALTRSMAVEFGQKNIRVNALAPGVVQTERTKKRVDSGQVKQNILDRHLLGLVNPIDVAQAALFLASEESRLITGQILSVDSGVTKN
jgi:NAD(P)-dependent dehydrogenase (short-subunit alcohol dehydrogenase family)